MAKQHEKAEGLPNEPNVGWRVGILIIGSLFWDTKRKKWREQLRFEKEAQPSIKVPIRYGRISKSRGNCYTMAFDPKLDDIKWGDAFVIEAKKRAADVDSLLTEAVELGEAEGIPDNMCIARWCAIGAVWRRAEPQVVREWRDKLATKATDAVRRKHPNRADIARLADLPFNWSILDADEKFDVLLAANCDPVAEWPSAADIAHRMYADTTRLGFEYFQKNRKAGITTFQDADILRELKALFEKDRDRLKWIDDQVNCFDATTRRSPSK